MHPRFRKLIKENHRWLSAFVWIYLLTQSESIEFCHNQEFTAECTQPDEVILITSALYGRMSIGPCVKTDFGFIGCYEDVIDHAHARCSGRRSCYIHVPDATLDRTRPCNEDLKSYLDATFACIAVAVPDGDSCELVSHNEDTIGFITSLEIPLPNRCGYSDTPWIITVLSGQRINVTLLDFSSANGFEDDDLSLTEVPTPPRETTTIVTQAVGFCDQYAMVQEVGAVGPHRRGSASGQVIDGKKAHYICGTKSVLSSHAYTSRGNSLLVTVFQKTDRYYNFLIKYEATGCSDSLPQSSPNVVWHRRDVNELTVECTNSGVTWKMTCIGTHWEGTETNCSVVGSKDARREDGLPSLSIGASILIILGVSLAIGLTVLLFGLYYMKKRRDSNLAGIPGSIQLRDMKPINSTETGYDAAGASIYARNTSFDPIAVAAMAPPPPVAPIASPIEIMRNEPCNAYEYVWEMQPCKTRTPAIGGKPVESRPDLVRLHHEGGSLQGMEPWREERGCSVPGSGPEIRVQCSCLLQPIQTIDPRTSNAAAAAAMYGKSAADKESFQQPLMGGAKECSGGGKSKPGTAFTKKILDCRLIGLGGRDTPSRPRVCRHCGHSIEGAVVIGAPEQGAAVRQCPCPHPNTGVLVRRSDPTPPGATTPAGNLERQSTTDAASIVSCPRRSTTGPATLPRQHTR